MVDMLSQDEIDALLGGNSKNTDTQLNLSDKDKDETIKILDKAMVKASEVLSNLINRHVTIKYDSISDYSSIESVLEKNKHLATKIYYKQGIKGESILLFRTEDAKNIANLMMGIEEKSDEELSDLQLSAITEAVSQMIGVSSTTISSVIGEKVDVSPPKTEKIDTVAELENLANIDDKNLVIIYKFLVDDTITSEIRLLMTESLVENMLDKVKSMENEKIKKQDDAMDMNFNNTNTRSEAKTSKNSNMISEKNNVNVKPVQFADIHPSVMQKQKENIDLIMDVPLEVTVELGRSHKSIREILEFAPGTIIELDKLAGEPIDILVNGKFVAKGEVIVIDENFGIRITEIIDVKDRI
ncbi:MAG: flagellar motor switch protein FliN [Clostridiales bacterium GWE2_32_10]|nr:MAG: flagellar motor switch protein FliN [Clostridiales bacterium GWE2_32_10]HBY20884.1 flagellar motor switch phosphatase FliY [Clostridiales bacterium]